MKLLSTAITFGTSLLLLLELKEKLGQKLKRKA